MRINYRVLLNEIVARDGERVCDIAEGLSAPLPRMVEVMAVLAEPHGLVTLSQKGPLGVVLCRFADSGAMWAAASDAGLSLDELVV